MYNIAEKIRYEKIGIKEFLGIKNNINSYYKEKLDNLDFKNDENKLINSFENYINFSCVIIKIK